MELIHPHSTFKRIYLWFGASNFDENDQLGIMRFRLASRVIWRLSELNVQVVLMLALIDVTNQAPEVLCNDVISI